MSSLEIDIDLYSLYQALTISGLQILPILLIPALLTSIQRIANFQDSPWSSTYGYKGYSKKIQEKVQNVIMNQRKQFGKALADTSSSMCVLYFLFVWAQAVRMSPENVADFDRLLMPLHVLVMYLCALFQGGFVEFSDLSNTWLGMVLNGTLIFGQFCINSWSDAVHYREELFIACRIFTGCIFCDHRKALCCEIFFICLHLLKGASGRGFPDQLEFCLMFLSAFSRWVIWYALEYFVKQFTSLTIQSADISASLAAFRAVLSSQCDAEAYLGEDLSFVDPSEKLAHYFGMKSEELRNRCVTEFLSQEDQDRLQKLVEASVEGLVTGPPRTSLCLTVTLQTGSGRSMETQLCLGSIPPNLAEGVCHVVALNEVRDVATGLPRADLLDEIIPQDAANLFETMATVPETPCPEAGTVPGVPLNAETLAFHAWSSEASAGFQPCGSVNAVTLRFDPTTLEVSDISLSVKSRGNRSAKGKRVALRECIVPGVWEEVNKWISKSVSGGDVQAPGIVPFAFPKMATEVLAARRAELKWVRSPNHSKELLLTLHDIRIRRFRERQHGSIHRAIGRGTRSAMSRESLVSNDSAGEEAARKRRVQLLPGSRGPGPG